MAQSDIDMLDLLADPDEPRDLIGFFVDIGPTIAEVAFMKIIGSGGTAAPVPHGQSN